jgi:uncharacterized protein (TIGR03067 family)
MHWRALVLVAAVAVVAADAKDDVSKKDLEALQGAWKPQKMVRGGVDMPAETVQQVRVVIEGNKWTFDVLGKKETAPFTIDATKTPRTITFGNPDGRTRADLGIYKLDGDTLHLCFVRGGAVRPKEFVSKDSESVLIVLKRAKK